MINVPEPYQACPAQNAQQQAAYQAHQSTIPTSILSEVPETMNAQGFSGKLVGLNGLFHLSTEQTHHDRPVFEKINPSGGPPCAIYYWDIPGEQNQSGWWIELMAGKSRDIWALNLSQDPYPPAKGWRITMDTRVDTDVKVTPYLESRQQQQPQQPRAQQQQQPHGQQRQQGQGCDVYGSQQNPQQQQQGQYGQQLQGNTNQRGNQQVQQYGGQKRQREQQQEDPEQVRKRQQMEEQFKQDEKSHEEDPT